MILEFNWNDGDKMVDNSKMCVVVGMSGGVDLFVIVLFLKE